MSFTAKAQTAGNVDIHKSLITWTGHAQIGTYSPTGTLTLKGGSIKIIAGKVVSAALEIDMTTLKQDNAQLAEHLKSDDFFAVDKYPLSRLSIKTIKSGIAYGTVTIKDNTRAVSFPVVMTIADGVVTITGKTSLDRTQFGVIYNSNSFFSNLGDHAISNTFEVAFKICTLPD
jgi:polyisoprenoid-binding protein YceI